MADPASSPPAAAPGPATAAPPELLVVGRLVAVQGLGGELRVLPLSDFPERFTRRGPRWLQAKGKPAQAVELRSGRQLPGKELFVVRLAGIDSRDAAEALVGQEFLVPAADRPPWRRVNSTCSIWWGWRYGCWRMSARRSGTTTRPEAALQANRGVGVRKRAMAQPVLRPKAWLPR